MSERKTLTEAEFKTRSRRSFLTGVAGIAAGYGGWRYIQGDEAVDRIPGVLRSGHERNASIWRTLYDGDRLAKTFDPNRADELRINGRKGLDNEIDLSQWTMDIVGRSGAVVGNHEIADIHALPFTEMTVEHKCVEGWSTIVTWGGTAFANLAAMYADDAEAPIVDLSTPDSKYYVSLDRDSMMHPQTLLAWELNGEPLTQLHGAPLRLVTPLKYGIKQLKRIGTISFADERGPDYWNERGYDWYSGL